MLYRLPHHPHHSRSIDKLRVHARTARLSVLVGVLLWAMVLMQTFGLVHRSAHFTHGASSVASLAGAAANPSSSPAPVSARTGHPAAGWLKTLFEGHSEGASCVLYDQLGHADALFSVPTLVLPDGISVLAEVVHPAWHLARQAAGFLARGPPTPV